jgi:hypothetical protein
MIKRNLPAYLAKWEKIYDRQILQLEFKYPDINPELTLSCKGVARVLNRKAQSSGHYQSQKMQALNLLQLARTYQHIPEQTPAQYESLIGLRSDIYSYMYNQRKRATGRARLYFRSLPNLIKPIEDAFFY